MWTLFNLFSFDFSPLIRSFLCLFAVTFFFHLNAFWRSFMIFLVDSIKWSTQTSRCWSTLAPTWIVFIDCLATSYKHRSTVRWAKVFGQQQNIYSFMVVFRQTNCVYPVVNRMRWMTKSLSHRWHSTETDECVQMKCERVEMLFCTLNAQIPRQMTQVCWFEFFWILFARWIVRILFKIFLFISNRFLCWQKMLNSKMSIMPTMMMWWR